MRFLIRVRETFASQVPRVQALWATTRHAQVPALVFCLTLVLYLRTLVPDVYVSDSALFQYLPVRLGLPHPNGFPLYMVLSWLWSHLPIRTVAWRMNLLSATSGALAAALTAAFARRLARRTSMALLAGGLVALSSTHWLYSLAAERYTLNLALLIGAIWAAWEGKARLSAFCLGLSLATHPIGVLLIPFWLVFVLRRTPAQRGSVRRWLAIAVAGMLPLLLYLYVPWRWQAFADWPMLPGIDRSSAIYRGLVHVWYEPPLRWDMVWRYIAGLGIAAAETTVGGWRKALERIPEFLPLLQAEIGWPTALAALIGLPSLLRRDTAITLTLGGFAVTLGLAVSYLHQGKPEAYLLPSFWLLLLAAAFALETALSAIQPVKTRFAWMARAADDRVAVCIVATSLLVLLWHRCPDLDLSHAVESRRWWMVTLSHPMEDGAGLLAHWSDLTPLWYLQQVEGRRPDLWGLFPPDPEEVTQPWLDMGLPLYLAGPLHGWVPDLAQRYTLMPWGNLVRILAPGQRTSCPPLSRSLSSPAAWPIRLSAWETEQPLVGGTSSTLRICWQARTELPIDTSLALELRRSSDAPPLRFDGPLAINWYPEDPIPDGTQGLTIMPLPLPVGTPPGTYTATLTIYRLDQQRGWKPWPRAETISLGQVEVAPSRDFTRASLANEVVPLVPLRTGPLTLRAWRVSQAPVRPGDPLQLDTLWQVQERPVTEVAVQAYFRDLGGRAIATPAQPLVPGLPPDAWQPGTVLRGTHTFRAPRGLGDRTYLLEAHLIIDSERIPWSPTGRLVLGTVQVKDRPHSYNMPDGVTPVDASFGEAVRLVGYTLNRAVSHPGDTLGLTLYWQADMDVGTSYTVFVHLVDHQGRLVAQHDSPPANDDLPTDLWVSGEIVTDPHRIRLPRDLPFGTYTLRAGMYNPSTGDRVTVGATTTTPDRALDLTTVEIMP